MAEIVCGGCGHHFPQKAKKGTVACPHCGRPTHIPGAVVCPECDHLNQDVSYCVECGAALFRECPECDARMEVDQKACGECGAIYADYLEEDETELRPVIDIGKICGTLATLALTALILFACWSVIISGQTKVGSTQGRPVVDSQLTRAQKEAQQQAELTQQTAAFEDIKVKIGEIIDLEKRKIPDNSAWEDLYATYPVVIENRGDVEHVVLLSYSFRKHNGNRTGPFYKEIVLQPQESISFEVVHLFGSAYDARGAVCGRDCAFKDPRQVDMMLVDNAWILVRLESVDSAGRSSTTLSKKEWDFTIEIHASPNYEDYHYPDE